MPESHRHDHHIGINILCRAGKCNGIFRRAVVIQRIDFCIFIALPVITLDQAPLSPARQRFLQNIVRRMTLWNDIQPEKYKASWDGKTHIPDPQALPDERCDITSAEVTTFYANDTDNLLQVNVSRKRHELFGH